MKKCILVCANCHRGIHTGYYTIPEEWQNSFNEKIAQQLLDELKEKHVYCKRCGKEITKKASYRKECSHILQQRTDKPSREELKDLIYNNSFLAIGRVFGVSDNTIRKWCKRVNLPHKKTIIKTFSEQEWKQI